MRGEDTGPSGVLLLDKPAGITSTRALAAAKRLVGSRKAGHTGTLDPFATGVLPIAFGEATKFARFLLDSRKGYLATLHLGHVTTTGDPEGEVLQDVPADLPLAKIEEVSAGFVGVQTQIPPMHSALHHQGRRLYEWARDGQTVDRPPRTIEIYDLKIVSKSGETLVISVNCSKGTYIRTLAIDLGERLGCGACLSALRRTSVGSFGIAESQSLEALEALGVQAAQGCLRPPESLVDGLAMQVLDGDGARRLAHGRVIACEPQLGAGDIALYGPRGAFLGVGLCDGLGTIAPQRLMASPEAVGAP